jgi:hypothetical protein
MSKVKIIKVLKSSNFADFERYLEEVLLSESSTLQIPNSLSYAGGFGMEGAALQLLGTWLRQSNQHALNTFIADATDSEQFSDLCNRLFGLCALRLSDQILSSKRQKVELSVALKAAIPIFNKMRAESFHDSFKGPYLAIPAIKTPFVKGGKNREFDSPLYNGDSVVGAQKFKALTINALDAILPGSSSSSRIDQAVIINISEILRELVTNTHRHARTDVFGNPLNKNFRGVIFNITSLSKDRLHDISKSGGIKLASFIGDWLPEEDMLFKALDITVVDSGPGYARRWIKEDKQDLTIDMERESIVKCFTKHNSSDAFDSAGSGLSNVLRDLRELKGWFRLRTGRALVEKSFFNQEGASTISSNDIKEVGAFAEGVVFNIVIPMQSLVGR